MGELSLPDAEQVACEVCGEQAVVFSFATEKMRGWCALHVPPVYAMCIFCGAEGAPLWKRQDGQIMVFCEKHLPKDEQWERVTLPRQEQPAAPPDAANQQAGG
jgi:hypothetical protein